MLDKAKLFISLGTMIVNLTFLPMISSSTALKPLTENKQAKEVFGFAPYWKFSQLDNIDFNVLTTLAYFGIPVDQNGYLVESDQGYITFNGAQATDLFRKAHAGGTRVVLTLTQMDDPTIEAFLDSDEARQRLIVSATDLVKERGIDGINIDFEYCGNSSDYRQKFSRFVAAITRKMHEKVPVSRVTVSVYASSVKEIKLYDIKALAQGSDGIFMMAYDFATSSADMAMPTAPLYGYRSGKYWYDVSTAVVDFLTEMPAEKLILGVPWYGYDYVVYEPKEKAETRPYYSWRGTPTAQTYGVASDLISPEAVGKKGYRSGWDSIGQVGWRAYYVPETDTWRMIFLEDIRSLGIKYDFVKEKNLGGVGIWALGFEEGKNDMWQLLTAKFGTKVADIRISEKPIYEKI